MSLDGGSVHVCDECVRDALKAIGAEPPNGLLISEKQAAPHMKEETSVNAFSFASEIVIPTVKEALADRGDRRRVYIASIVTYALIDYIAAETGEEKRVIRDSVRNVCTPAFEVVQGVCNGTKHAETTRGFPFKPGADRDVPAFAFDVPGAGFDQGRWGGPGLSVQRDGIELFLDVALQVVLITLCNNHKVQLGNIDLSFLDKAILRKPG
jgi:hypothetical protein